MRRYPERAIQRQVIRLLRGVGCGVYVIGTTRPRGDYQGTCQTPGLSDLLVFLPRGLGVLFAEVKAPGGRMRREQALFRMACEACLAPYRVHYVTGGVDAVIAYLMDIGLLKPAQVAYYRAPA